METKWVGVAMEQNGNPQEGELVQFLAMHILKFERLVRDYGIPREDDGYFYLRESELPSNVYQALGWQGGTVHQVIEQIGKLRRVSAACRGLADYLGNHDFSGPAELQSKFIDIFEALNKAEGK